MPSQCCTSKFHTVNLQIFSFFQSALKARKELLVTMFRNIQIPAVDLITDWEDDRVKFLDNHSVQVDEDGKFSTF